MQRPAAIRTASCLLAATLLGGCSSWLNSPDPGLGWLSPHRIDIQQGNVVTQEQLARLKPGMSRLQVRDVLGTPLISDVFHADRWDYIFTLRQSGRPLQRRSVVLTFDGDTLKNIEAPDLPSEREFVDSISRSGRIVAAADLELSPDQLRNLPLPTRAGPLPPANNVPNPIPATRTFPPLEPS